MGKQRATRSFERALVALGILGILGVSGCSSSGVQEGEPLPDAVIAPPEAGTDPVPPPSAELGALPAEATALPPPADTPVDSAAPPPVEALNSADPTEPPPATPDLAGSSAPTPPADAAPEPSMAASAEPTASAGTENYTVKSGDTLMMIAFETYGDLYKWKDIYEANKEQIQNPNRVPPGTVLRLERPAVPVTIDRNGERYTIRRGDTLGTISRELYGTPRKWKRLWKNNPQLIKDPNKIYAGFYLYYLPADQSPLKQEPLANSEVPRQPAASSGVETPVQPAASDAPPLPPTQ